MSKDQAWRDYWRSWYPNEPNVLGNHRRDEILNAFLAGYDARRAEEDEAVKVIRSAAGYVNLPDVPCSRHHRCLWKDGHEGKCHYRKLANVGQEETGNWVEGHTKRFSNTAQEPTYKICDKCGNPFCYPASDNADHRTTCGWCLANVG